MSRTASFVAAHRNISRRFSNIFMEEKTHDVDLRPKIPSNKSEFRFDKILSTFLNGVCRSELLDFVEICHELVFKFFPCCDASMNGQVWQKRRIICSDTTLYVTLVGDDFIRDHIPLV